MTDGEGADHPVEARPGGHIEQARFLPVVEGYMRGEHAMCSRNCGTCRSITLNFRISSSGAWRTG